jgi:hypothetical protein
MGGLVARVGKGKDVCRGLGGIMREGSTGDTQA